MGKGVGGGVRGECGGGEGGRGGQWVSAKGWREGKVGGGTERYKTEGRRAFGRGRPPPHTHNHTHMRTGENEDIGYRISD